MISLPFHEQEAIVFHALSWSLTFVLLALWSLAVWGFHSIAAWTVSNADVLSGGTGAIETARVPDWLAPWVPPDLALAFASMLSAFRPAIEAVLDLVPALANGLALAAWTVWGIGAALLVVLGLVCSLLISVLRRRASAFATPSRGSAAAG